MKIIRIALLSLNVKSLNISIINTTTDVHSVYNVPTTTATAAAAAGAAQSF